ncbi:hypothetical protein D910_12646 [Dendroctonus ponderosae]|uniref:Methuselah N-terminal domain-containing protein n=1 Tax=Dendroctonus ponderosae TaxID=77166 RepID=U4UQL0_DENPD|nr:hypothetical protein D910_12646 [Dendroctonus ponderosae]
MNIGDEYLFLGQRISFNKDSQRAENSRRILFEWQHMENIVMSQCVLPTLTYAAETWRLNEGTMDRLRIAQRKMERKMLGILLQYQKTNERIGQNTKVIVVPERVTRLKWKLAGQDIKSHTSTSNLGNISVEDYCTDRTEDGTELVRICTSDFQICKFAQCVHKCCPDGFSFVNGSHCHPTFIHGLDLNFSESIQRNVLANERFSRKLFLQHLSGNNSSSSRMFT